MAACRLITDHRGDSVSRLNRWIYLPSFRAIQTWQGFSVGLLRVLTIMTLLWPMAGTAQIGSGHAPGLAGNKQIEGYWVRPDGGYILYLYDIKEDGVLNAAYYNPRPINVSRAEVSDRDGKVNLFVELQDVNYPGSTYTLAYDPATDRLRGVYFQATSGKSFQIEFERMK